MKKFYLIAGVICAVLLLYLGLVYLSFSSNKQTLKTLAVQNQVSTVKFYKNRLDEWLLAKKKAIDMAIMSLSNTKEDQISTIREILKNTAGIGEFDGVYVGYEDDRYIISTDEIVPNGYKPSQRQWYKTALEANKTSITLPYEDAFIPGNIRFSVVSAFKTPLGKQAVVSADIELKKIRDEISNINKNLQGFAFLTTKDGEIIAGENAKIPNQCAECKIAVEMIKQGLKEYGIYGERFILFYESLDSSDWVFAMSLNEGEIFKKLDENLRQNVFLALFLALFGIAGSYLTLRLTDYARRQNLIKEQILIQNAKMATMSEMFVAITHQWRQPISAIMILADTIKINLGSNQDANIKKIEEINEIISFLDETLNSFKLFFRAKNEREEVDLVRIIKDVFLIAKPLAGIAGASLELNFDRDKSYIVKTYPNYLKQVLLNLISNAKDAVYERRNGGFIRLNLSMQGDEYIINIEDNGVGIDQNIRENLFKELKSTKGEKGTGNGLFICKLLLENRLKGTIAVKSYIEPTVFEIRLKNE